MSLADIKELRQRTGAGMLDCKKALAETGGDIEAAVDWLRKKGIAKAAKKAGRVAAEGLVHAYIHHGGRVGVLVEVNCETDFVARTDRFKELVNDIAMHIAASSPDYLSKDDVPEADLERERKLQIERVMAEGKPEHIAERIVQGRMAKFFEEHCLLEQPFVKDDSKTVGEVIAEAVGSIGENIRVRRFVRYELGEGIQKRQDDFAAEVAAAVGG